MLLAVILLGGGIYFASTIFKFDTPAGTVILEVNHADVDVHVDGKKITITRPGDKQPLTISVDEGKHTLMVKRDFDSLPTNSRSNPVPEKRSKCAWNRWVRM